MANLEDLPVEVKCMILAKLPIKEIARSRRVSQSFDTLIQNPQNRTLLLGQRTESKLAEMEKTINRLCYFRVADSYCAFIDAVQIYFEHRGIHRSSMRAAEASKFVSLWTRRMEDDTINTWALIGLVRRILWIHIRHHVPRLWDPDSPRLESRLFRPQFPIAGSGFKSRQEWRMAKGRLTYPGIGLWDPEVSAPGLEGRYEHINNRYGWCSILGGNAVADLLQIPRIPIFAGDVFGYKLRSKASFDLIYKAMEQRTKIDGLKRAAVIDDMYIY